MRQPGFTVWFTGLSGSGKSTIARLVAENLRNRGRRVELLSGAEFRQNISQGLGFSREDRIANVRRIGYVAKLLTRNGVAVITTSISPYRHVRDECRLMIGNFVEVLVDCPIELCEVRDPKGLYARARRGELSDVTGVTEAYEPPLDPEIVLHTDREPPSECAARVLAYLEARGWVARQTEARVSADAEIVRTHLRALGDG
jgi:adenylyl-sulfate kinase